MGTDAATAIPIIGWPQKLGAALQMLLVYFGIQDAALVLRLSPRMFSPELLKEREWIGLYENHFWQLVFALILIGVFSGGKFSDWGLNIRNASVSWRILKKYCVVYFFIVLIVNVLPPVLHHDPPSLGYPLTVSNILGWLSFEWIFVGISEEIMFRGLIHTFLTRTWTGVWTVAGLTIPSAGLITTIIFCLAHINPLHPHVYWLQQVFAFGVGIYYSAVYHRTGSLLNPILAHNYGDGLIFAVLYVLHAWMR